MAARAQARAGGLTWAMERTRRQTGRLFEPLPAVLSLTPTLTDDGWRSAAVIWSAGVLGHETALELFGLRQADGSIHVISPTRRQPPNERIVVHFTRRLARGDLTRVRGLRTTTVPRAALDVAARVPPGGLRALVHEAQYRGLIDRASLEWVLRTHPGHPGLAALGAVEPAPPRTESGLERRLGRILSRVPGPPFVRQHWLTLADGRRIRADFAYLEERIIVEADGRDAHARMLAFADDRARDNAALESGWLTLRYVNEDLRRPERIVDQVEAVRGVRARSAGR